MRYIMFLVLFFLVSNFFGQADKVNQIMSNNKEIDSLIKVFEYETAQKLLFNSSDLANRINIDSISAIVYEAHAKYYYYTSNYQKTAKYLIESAKIYDKIGDRNKAIRMYNNIAAILGSLGQYKKALDTRKKILNYDEIDDDLSFKTSVLSNIGSDYRKLNQNDSAFYYLKNALKVSKENKLENLIGAVYKKIQKTYLELKQYQLSIRYGDSVLIFRNEIERPLYENSIIDAAQAYYNIKDYNSALKKCLLAEDLINESKMVINLPTVYELMSSIYEQKQQYKKANSLLKKRIEIRDSLLSKEKQKQILELEQKYQTEKKEKENLKLKTESVEKDLKLANKNNVILIGSLAFGIILVSLILYQLKRMRNKNIELRVEIEQREILEKELQIVRDNIAKDFHDDLGNKLARIVTLSDLMISTSENRDKAHIVKALKSIKMDSDVLYKGTRDFMFSLKAKSDYLEELFTYLSDFGEEFFESFDIDFFVDKKIERNIKLPYYWNRQIIMIFKEAMTNVVKHSKAKHVTLSIHQEDDGLVMSLKDAGVGFDMSDLKHKNGLSNMRARAEKIGATLNIRSDEKGTLVELNTKLQVQKEKANHEKI